MRTAFSREKVEGTPYLSWEPTIGRNSAFPDLTEEQREELGGIEVEVDDGYIMDDEDMEYGFWE